MDWIQQQPFYKNTTIIISGDHQSMDPSVANYHGRTPLNRGIYYTVINADPKLAHHDYFKNRIASDLDGFPTELASIGASIKGDHLGLGYNLFSNEKTLIERFGLKEINQQLSSHSNFYEKELF